MVVERDEDGVLLGEVTEMPGCHTQAKDLKSLEERMKKAIQLYLEANPGARRGSRDPRFVGVHVVEV